jgi:uracil-DNA glycosylase
MRPKSTTLKGTIRQALRSQIELGAREVIVTRRKRNIDGAPVSSGTKVSAPALFPAQALSLDIDQRPEVQRKQYPSLSAHREAICNCQLCTLGSTRNKFVYGVGNPNAKLLFIGEAPGADEDRLGEPFVGRAGQLLDKILVAINFTRQDIYIANILKCRPPNNRDPLPDEVAKCRPYLDEQIRIIQPKLICLLGRIAAQSLFNVTTPLGKMRGQWLDYNGIPVLVTYHPAALLRFPAYKKETWEDMQKLRARYDSL